MHDPRPEHLAGGPGAASVGHESALLGTAPIVAFSIGLAALIVLAAFVAFFLLGGFRPPPPGVRSLPPAGTGPASMPILQSAPAADLRAFRRGKESMLDGYRWIDRGSGVVQIPIERAMQLIVERDAAQGSAHAKSERP